MDPWTVFLVAAIGGFFGGFGCGLGGVLARAVQP